MTTPNPGRHAQAAQSRADKARADSAKEIAQAEACDSAEAALPAGIPTPDKVHPYTPYAPVVVEITAHDRAEALDFFDAFDVEPIARVRHGCLSFKPAAQIKASERERGEVLEGPADLWPLVWRYDPSPHLGGKPAASLLWFATLADGSRAEVRCAIVNDPARVTAHHQHAGKTTRSRVVRYAWQLSDGPDWHAAGLDRYSSGTHDHCGQYVAYFYVEPNNGQLPAAYLGVTDAECECSTHFEDRRPTCERCAVLKAERAAARAGRESK